MRVSDDVAMVLDRCGTDGNALTLPPGQMDRKAYVAINKVLETAGGKWNRSAKAHLFDDPAADVLDQLLLTREITSKRTVLGYFPTPPAVVDSLLSLADLTAGLKVLEPSAGRGAIAGPVAATGCIVDCFEVDPANAEVIRMAGYAQHLTACDFLEVEPGGLPRYDRVVMNPPFAKQADVAHVTHALRFLRPGGLLVSVMALGVTFRLASAAVAFREMVAERGGEFVPVPDGSFKVSGTEVSTVIAVVPAGA
jgi:predicted RNA methylase